MPSPATFLARAAVACVLLAASATTAEEPVDRVTLKGGQVVEGRVEDRNEGGLTILEGGQSRSIAAEVVEKVEWDLRRQKTPWGAHLGGGRATPLSPDGFTRASLGGPGVGAALSWAFSKHFGLRAAMDYTLFPLNKERAVQGLGPIASVEGGDTWLGMALLELKIAPVGWEGRWVPYAALGAGVADRSTRFLEVVTGAGGLIQTQGFSRTGTALGVCLGVEGYFSRFVGFFLEAGWATALGVDRDSGSLALLPLRAGISLRYSGVDSGTRAQP